MSTATIAAMRYISGCMTCRCPPGRALDEFVVPDGFRMLLAELVGESAQFLLGGFGADARREATPHTDGGVGPVGEGFAAFDEVRLLRYRHPELRVLAAETGEGVGSDADDGGGALVDMNDAANDIGIAGEAVLPEFVAEDDGGRRGRRGIERGLEEAAVSSVGTEFREVVGRDERGAGELDIVVDLHGRDAEHGDCGGQGSRVLLIEEERWVGHLAGVVTGRAALEADDARGIAHG